MGDSEEFLTETGPDDVAGRALGELELAAEADDETRLNFLDELYRCLEGELERDVEQTGAPRH